MFEAYKRLPNFFEFFSFSPDVLHKSTYSYAGIPLKNVRVREESFMTGEKCFTFISEKKSN